MDIYIYVCMYVIQYIEQNKLKHRHHNDLKNKILEFASTYGDSVTNTTASH